MEVDGGILKHMEPLQQLNKLRNRQALALKRCRAKLAAKKTTATWNGQLEKKHHNKTM